MTGKHFKNDPATLGFKGKHVAELIQPGKYMNASSFIRWPRTRLHGHFYSVPTLKFTDASEPLMGKQRLQWQSLCAGRLLIISKGQPLSPSQLYTNGQGALAEQKESSWELETWNWKHGASVICTQCFSWEEWHALVDSGFPACVLVLTLTVIHNASQTAEKKEMKVTLDKICKYDF